MALAVGGRFGVAGGRNQTLERMLRPVLSLVLLLSAMSIHAVPASDSSALHQRLLAEAPWYEVQQEGPGTPGTADFKGGVMRMHPLNGDLALLQIDAEGFETLVGAQSHKVRITKWATAEGDAVGIEGTDDQGHWVRVTVKTVRFLAKFMTRGTPESRRDIDAILWTVTREPTTGELAASGGALRDGVAGHLYFVSSRDLDAVPEGHEF